MPDAVVVGAGPNGLVAANVLADHGWSVAVLEAADAPGGAVRSEELIEPGFVNDVCSALYPLAVASPAIEPLGLERHGLRWRTAPVTVAHPASDGSCAILDTVEGTSASLDEFAGGDGAAWRDLYSRWQQFHPHIVRALLTPFPPLRALAGIGLKGRGRLLDVARLGVVPVRRLGDEQFHGPGAKRLLAGLALHADLLPESALGGFFAWLMAGLGQQYGFPVPEGGAGRLTAALVARLLDNGATLACRSPVVEVVVRRGRAVAVRTADGTTVDARRAVVADVDAVQLYMHLVAREHLPARTLDHVTRFHWDHATFKVDWNLDAPIPWSAAPARRAGTVHVAEDVNELTRAGASITTGQVPAEPFLVIGQQSMTDPTRQPLGKETAWAYTHLPRDIRGDDGPDRITGRWDVGDRDALADRIEQRIEALAPGFRALVRGRHVLAPVDFMAKDRNLVLGALNLGTAQLHQQVFFRPVPGLARSETPVAGLFLGSASAHPGGGVHGACGANAARAALLHDRLHRLQRAALRR